VRFIQAPVKIRGKREVIWFATSLLNTEKYPANEIAALYIKRWRVEAVISQTKINMSADVVRSMSKEGVLKEVAAKMTALNIVRTVIIEAAIQENIKPIKISFTSALRSLIAFAPAFASEPLWKLKGIYVAMLRNIASNTVPYRPGREEPRAVRREFHHFPSLRTTRAEWRQMNVA